MKFFPPLLVLFCLNPALFSDTEFSQALAIAEKNSTTLKKIQNFGCDLNYHRVETINGSRKDIVESGKYFFGKGINKYIIKIDDDRFVVCFSKDGIEKLLSSKVSSSNLTKSLGRPIPQGEGYLSGAIRKKITQGTPSWWDLHRAALFWFDHPDLANERMDLPLVELKDLLKHPKRKFESLKRDSDGNEIILLKGTGEKGAVFYHQFTVSPRLNYLVTDFVSFQENVGEGYLRSKSVIAEWKDMGNGIYFPIAMKREVKPRGVPWINEEMTLDQIEVNSKTVEANLTFQFPEDIQVTDYTTNVIYQSLPGGGLKEYGKYTPPPWEIGANGSPSFAVSQESRFSWPLAFVGLSGFFLFCALIFWIRKRIARSG